MPDYTPVVNDNLTEAFSALDLIPDAYKGSDRFLDIVSWNLRYFHDQDYNRVERIVNIMDALNADVFVLQEILDGSLQAVADGLSDAGAGYYQVAYGQTGGNQRVAVMYDLDWVRAKDDIHEIFNDKDYLSPDGKKAFPRRPLWGFFTCLTYDPQEAPFDFQLLGLHLKSQRGGGGAQRQKSAELLRDWLTEKAVLTDADVIMAGDWNEPPDSSTWDPIKELETQGEVAFAGVNDASDFSHLMYRNKKNLGSRLDLAAISVAALAEMRDAPATVRWTTLDKLLEANPKAKQLKAYIKEVRDKISDHMPVVTRFYFTERDSS